MSQENKTPLKREKMSEKKAPQMPKEKEPKEPLPIKELVYSKTVFIPKHALRTAGEKVTAADIKAWAAWTDTPMDDYVKPL